MLRRLVQFRIRTLLLIITVFCGATASFVRPYFVQEAAIQRLTEKARLEFSAGKPRWLRPIMGAKFRRAHVLKLSPNATDRDMRIAPELPFLERIYLQFSKVTDVGFRNLEPIHQLHTIGLRRSRVSDRGLRSIASCRNLKTLEINHTAATGACLEFLPTDIELLIADSRVWNVGTIPHLQRFKSLNIRRLDLSYEGLSGNDLAKLRGNRIQRLLLRGNQITDEGLLHLKSIEGLSYVDVSATSVTRTAAEQFGAEYKCTVVCEPRARLHNYALRWFKEYSREIHATHQEGTYTPVTRPLQGDPLFRTSYVEYLPLLQTLTELNVSTDALHEEEIEYLQRIPNLRRLTMRGPGSYGRFVEPWWLLYLSRSRSIEELRLPNNEVTGWSLQYLSELPLRKLDLTANRLVDEELSALEKLPHLKELTLKNNPITDDGLKHLTKLIELEVLDVSGCDVSASAVAELELQLPQTHVVSDK